MQDKKGRDIYLDACIFVANFYTNDSNNKHNRTKDFLKKVSKTDSIRLVSSLWALTETTDVLSKKEGMDKNLINKYTMKLAWKNRIDNLKFEWLPFSPETKYDFADFTYEIMENLIDYKQNLRDTIHFTIMANNEVNHIATFDSDFNGFKELVIINPDEIENYIEETKGTTLRTKIRVKTKKRVVAGKLDL